MATAQGQDTGKAPENQDTGSEAPVADDFGDVFAQLTGPEPAATGATGPTGGAGGEVGATGASAPMGGETGPTGSAGGLPNPSDVNADGSVKGPTGAAQEPEPKPTAGATGPTPAATPDQSRAFLDELKGILKPEPAPKQEAAPPAVTPFTAEQTTSIAKAREEYPEVFAAMDLLADQRAQVIVDHVFSQLRPIIAELQGKVVETSNASHDQQLAAAVPDYVEVAPKVMDWIGKQPPFLKAAYDKVAASGTVAEVVQMIDQYRASTGTAAPRPAPANANATQGGAPDAAAQAAAAAAETARRAKIAQASAPVGGKRSGSTVEVLDANDYAGAFDSFAESLAKAG